MDSSPDGVTDLNTKRSKVRPRKRWGLRLAILLGLLLGLAFVLFFVHIYNPFGASVDSPSVLLPPDVDFVLNFPDLPHFLSGLRDTDFAEAMKKHPGFQEFLQSETMRDQGLVEVIQNAFRKLDLLSDGMPLGLSLMPDVTGRQVLLAGYLPAKPGDPLRFMAIFRPASWKAMAGVNTLLSPKLSGWFLEEPLRSEGMELSHTRDMAAITLPESEGVAKGARRKIWITRIADLVVLSTEERQLAQIRSSVEKDGIPRSADSRFAGLNEFLEAHPAQLLVRRASGDRFIQLTEKLDEAWGVPLRTKLEATIPRLGGEDVILGMDFSRSVEIKLQGARGLGLKDDMGDAFRPFQKHQLEAEVQKLGAMLPSDGFGLVHFQMPFGDLFDRLLSREVSPEDLRLIEDGFSKLSTIGSREALRARLNDLVGDRVSIVFFRQPRAVLSDQAEAGVLLACAVDRMGPLRTFLEELFAEIQRTSESGIREAVPMPFADGQLWKLVLAAGVVDDARVTIPSVGLLGGYVMFSNYLPFMELIPSVMARDRPSMGSLPGIQEATAYAPSDLLLASVLDGSALEPYLDQSASGWAYSRTRVTQMDLMNFAEQGRRNALARGLRPGTEAFDQEVESHKIREENQRAGAERDLQYRKIKSMVDQFRGFFLSFGFFVENTRGGVGYSLRLLPKRPA